MDEFDLQKEMDQIVENVHNVAMNPIVFTDDSPASATDIIAYIGTKMIPGLVMSGEPPDKSLPLMVDLLLKAGVPEEKVCGFLQDGFRKAWEHEQTCPHHGESNAVQPSEEGIKAMLKDLESVQSVQDVPGTDGLLHGYL